MFPALKIYLHPFRSFVAVFVCRLLKTIVDLSFLGTT